MLKAIAMLTIGALILLGAVASGIGVLRFIRESSVADGRVASLNAGGSHPEIEFMAANGARISFPEGGWIGGYKPGDAVLVRYDIRNPAISAELDSFGALWFWPTLLLIFGLGWMWGGWSEWTERQGLGKERGVAAEAK